MRRLPAALFAIVFFCVGLFAASYVFASSPQAYKDYLYQYDTYRANYSDFQVAKNTYQKFGTLESQTTALDKTKTMLTQRDQLLRAYLLFLNEKLNENSGLVGTTRQTYQALTNNEIKFLDAHAQLIPSVASLADAQTVSTQLESHYTILQTSIRQIIIGLALGDLATFAMQYDTQLQQAQTIIASQGSVFPQDKLNTINRWILQITNKRSLYQQLINQVSSVNTQLNTNDLQDLTQKFAAMQAGIGSARQYLIEGTSYMGELTDALRYQN